MSVEVNVDDLEAALFKELIKVRKEKGISQTELGELSGFRQPVISRIEHGLLSPYLSTMIKVLAPLGKTLYIGDL